VSSAAHSTDRVAPLLLELARACRAAGFYAPGHAAVRNAIGRAGSVWAETLRDGSDLEFELRDGHLALADGPVVDAECEELSRQLAGRGVARLRICVGVEPEEISALVRALCGRDVGVEQALAAEAVQRVRISAPGAGAAGDAGASGAPRANPTEASDATGLARAVEQLETAAEGEPYAELTRRVVEGGTRLAQSGELEHAYAGLLCLARHSVESHARPEGVRNTARRALRELMQSDDLLEFVLESTASDSVEGSIKATEVLVASGASVVPRLLARHARGETEVRSRISAVLIAMGDGAFPVLVDELTSRDSARVRRAARLLGDMQHPRGVDFLVQHLGDADPYVKKEVGMALTRIGTERALEALVRALDGDDATAPIAAACLGNSRAESVMQALVGVIESSGRRSLQLRREAVRSLGRIGRSEAAGAIAQVLQRRAWFRRKHNRLLRVAAAHALGRIGGPDAFGYLDEHSRHGDPAVRQACSEALRLLLATPARS
jgi:HEAT repeat protein